MKGTADCRHFILPKAEAVRVERTGARTPGGLAHRCTTFCATPPKELAEGAGVEPAGALRLRQFSGLLGVPVPNLPRLAGAPGFEPGRAGLESASLSLSLRPLSMHQEGFEPPRPPREPQLYRLLPSRFGL